LPGIGRRLWLRCATDDQKRDYNGRCSSDGKPRSDAERLPQYRPAHSPLALDVAAVALPFRDLGLRFALAIGRERASHAYFFLELTLLVAPDVTPVAFLWLNDSAFTGFAFLFRWHFVLLFFAGNSHDAIQPVVSMFGPRDEIESTFPDTGFAHPQS
jgi:hypothetical protein